MKKYFLWMGALILTLTTPIYAQDIYIYFNNQNIKMDVVPENKENVVYAPISLYF